MRRRKDQNFDRQLIGLRGAATPAGNLILVHVTSAWAAKEILFVKKLTTKKCGVFNTDLLYFFVLRPAYQSKIGCEESHQLSRFPVAFLLDKSAVAEPRHVYPFDTGGAAVGAFDSQADPYVPLEDYALPPSYEAIGEFIGWSFGTFDSYLDGTLRTDLQSELKPFQSVAVSYVDIARLGVAGSNEHDTRASSIELASRHNVDLTGVVKLIIAPKQFLEGNEPVLNLIKPLIVDGAQIELYDWQANRTPNEYQSDILRISRNWYKKNGVL